MMLSAAEIIQKVDPLNVKGIYRKAFAEEKLEKYKEAL